MALADLLHGLFVLLTICTYALPLYEGVKRQSGFYVLLFGALALMSFALHCEETGICSDLPPKLHLRLQTLDMGLSYFLLNTMALVVLDIRNEVAGRLAGAVTSAALMARNVFDLRFNLAACAAFGAAALVVDTVVYGRRFTPAWWRRLALITGMAAVGAILFRLLKLLWAWHGIWHVYYVATCYLLLAAQREKQAKVASRAANAGGASSGGRSQAVQVLSTPIKRPPRADTSGANAVGDGTASGSEVEA